MVRPRSCANEKKKLAKHVRRKVGRWGGEDAAWVDVDGAGVILRMRSAEAIQIDVHAVTGYGTGWPTHSSSSIKKVFWLNSSLCERFNVIRGPWEKIAAKSVQGMARSRAARPFGLQRWVRITII